MCRAGFARRVNSVSTGGLAGERFLSPYSPKLVHQRVTIGRQGPMCVSHFLEASLSDALRDQPERTELDLDSLEIGVEHFGGWSFNAMAFCEPANFRGEPVF